MAMGSCSRRNALLYSCLGTTIEMLLGTPPNKRPHTKQCMRSSPYHSFRQVYRRRPLDNINILYGFVPPGSSQSSQTHRSMKRPQRTTRIILISPVPLTPTIPRLQLYFFVVGSVFVGTSTDVGRTR